MSERTVATKTILMREDLFEVVLDLARWYTLYNNVGGSSYEVLGVTTSSHSLIVSTTPVSTANTEWDIKVLANHLKDNEQLRIYGIALA